MDNKYKTFGEMEPYGGKYAKIKEKMKTDQTENVKRLTTSDDAYSPEKMYMSAKDKRYKFAKEVPEGTKDAKYFKQLTPIEQSRLIDNKRRAQKTKGTKSEVGYKKIKTRPRKIRVKSRKPKLSLRGGGRAYGKNS